MIVIFQIIIVLFFDNNFNNYSYEGKYILKMGNCNAGPIKTKALTIAHPIYEIVTVDGNQSQTPSVFGPQTNSGMQDSNNNNNNFSISNPIVYRALW
jgi:hypothetical protein